MMDCSQQHGCALGHGFCLASPSANKTGLQARAERSLAAWRCLQDQLPLDVKRLLSHGMHKRPEAARSLTTATRSFAVRGCSLV
jgi:hypothetical protein